MTSAHEHNRLSSKGSDDLTTKVDKVKSRRKKEPTREWIIGDK